MRKDVHQKFTQVEIARKQAELFHGEFGAREALGKIRPRQPVLGEFFDIGLADNALFLATAHRLYRIAAKP